MTMKYYTDTHIFAEYSSMTKDKKIEILNEALGHMESSNTRSKFECIALAMGYRNHEGLEDTYYKRSEQ